MTVPYHVHRNGETNYFTRILRIPHALQGYIVMLNVNELKEGKRQKSGEYGNC